MCLEIFTQIVIRKMPHSQRIQYSPVHANEIILFLVSRLREHIILNMTVNSQFNVCGCLQSTVNSQLTFFGDL